MSFGSRLLKLRMEKNFSQEELAEKLEVSRLTIHRWEYDKSAPNVAQIKVLCALFDVNVSYFFEESEPDLEIAPASEAEEKPLSKAFKRKKELITVVLSSIVMFLCMALIVIVGVPQESILDKVMFGNGSVEVKKIYVNMPALLMCIVLLVVTTIFLVVSLKNLLNNGKNEKL